MVFYSLYIISKSGGLIFQQDLSKKAPKLSSNDHLRLGSTFHSMFAISRLVSPVKSDGIQSLKTDTFDLQCFQSQTGITFFLTAELMTDFGNVLQLIYAAYADYVLKNPFYELEMPIRCKLFNERLQEIIESHFMDTGKRRLEGF